MMPATLSAGAFSLLQAAPVSLGFLRVDDAFTEVNVPNAISTTAADVNNRGQIVGTFYDGTSHGFVTGNGVLLVINVPGPQNTGVEGINNAGQMVGSFFDGVTGPYHGFLYSEVPFP
jgi:probable HAF family extracellular repeat protein